MTINVGAVPGTGYRAGACPLCGARVLLHTRPGRTECQCGAIYDHLTRELVDQRAELGHKHPEVHTMATFTWRPTHVVGGEPVMLVPDTEMSAMEAGSLYPSAEHLAGSVGAFTAADWEPEDATASYRRLADGSWLRWTDNAWQDCTAQVTEVTP